MQLWVGLGNPGAKYAGNRHNIGFMVINAIGDDHNFSNEKSQFKGLVRQGMISAEGRPVKVLLLKPTTFMNESGRSVQQAITGCVLSDSIAAKTFTASALALVTPAIRIKSTAMC